MAGRVGLSSFPCSSYRFLRSHRSIVRLLPLSAKSVSSRSHSAVKLRKNHEFAGTGAVFGGRSTQISGLADKRGIQPWEDIAAVEFLDSPFDVNSDFNINFILSLGRPGPIARPRVLEYEPASRPFGIPD